MDYFITLLLFNVKIKKGYERFQNCISNYKYSAVGR